jgi:hypothetical protein
VVRAKDLPVRQLSALETVAIISVAGSVLAATVPAFISNLRASRLSEPVEGLAHLAARATSFAVGRPVDQAYPISVALTPARVPTGQRVVDPAGTWDHPTWRRLDFVQVDPHSFSFEFESHLGADRSTFVARAHGDLDGDGVMSEFEVTGESRPSEEPTIGPLRVYREVE